MKKTRDYDNTFQTIKTKHKRLLIGIINDCFQKNYPMNTEVELLPTRSHLVNDNNAGKTELEDRESDVVLKIEGDYYLLEVQAYDDENMAIRIAEYIFLTARDRTSGEQGKVALNMPHFTVIYIKPTKGTPRKTEITYNFPDGQSVTYSENNVFLTDLTKEEIIEKKLYAYIPFYIARYEKELSTEKNYQKAVEDLAYFRDKMVKLHEEQQLTGEEFTNLGYFVNTIVTHITDGNDIEKEVTGIMGGTPYETASERIQREVYEQFKDQLDEKNQKLAESEKKLDEKDKKLYEKDKKLDEKDRRIAELEALLAARPMA